MRELTLNELELITGARGLTSLKGSSGSNFVDALGLYSAYTAGKDIGTAIYNNSETVRNVSGHIIETFDKVITEIRNEPRPDIGRQQGIDRMREMERINRETLKNAKQDSDAQPKDGSMYHC